MQRIHDATAAPALPAPPTLTGPAGYFTGGAPGTVTPTVVRDWWLNMVQEELLALLTAAGIAPDTTGTNFHQVLDAIKNGLGGAVRVRLNAPITLYVSTTGDDSGAHNGLSPAQAFKTLQSAWSVLTNYYDLNGYAASIQILDGTYTGPTILSGPLPGQVGPVGIFGNVATPANVVLNCVTSDVCLMVTWGAQISLQGVRIQNSGATLPNNAAGNGLFVTNGSYVGLNHVDFGPCTTGQIFARLGSSIDTIGGAPYSISGPANYHILVDVGSSVVTALSTVTITGNPNFRNIFAAVTNNAVLEMWSQTFTGTCTGVRWQSSQNGSLILNGANPDTYLPGSIAGGFVSGGIVA